MAYRYFSAEKLPADESAYPVSVLLDGEEAHHLIHVMRVKAGEALILFDGSGAEFDTVISSVRKKELAAEIRSRRIENRESVRDVILAVALPKGERQRWLIEKLVELGAAEFMPLEAERSVAKAGEAAAARMNRVVIEASKQCGRNTLMKLQEAKTSKAIFSRSFSEAPENAEILKVIAHPGGQSLAELLAATENQGKKLLAAIGPEGGFSESEAENALNSGWIPVSLGKRILRTETAAMMVCAIAAD
ncbi:MAG: 16S rRNA (uracil(1498)-N(3))-methyltransferase [Planctomycetaceae bacterium]|nr:16S rRNA (uracil(1498)-N(3))-methyltransferase [Planctomycetaceae bacterium]MBQ2822654.1 16S rRNA (uracil(1498)-N(3))-methyltransferase [Thermoguttaceae bacterium]